MSVRAEQPRWRRIIAIYRDVLTGKSFACDASFEGTPHLPHEWYSAFVRRSFHCEGVE